MKPMSEGKRFIDKSYGHFNPQATERKVKCPRCGGMGSVTTNEDAFVFLCESCGKTERSTRRVYRYHTPGICVACGRYFNGKVMDDRAISHKTLFIACPHCGARQPCRVEKTEDGDRCFEHERIDLNGVEDIFGYPLWFRTELDGKVVWALNREHLAYLIDYIGADLREGTGGMAQSDHLPKFMKLSKNRERLLKRLRRMQCRQDLP